MRSVAISGAIVLLASCVSAAEKPPAELQALRATFATAIEKNDSAAAAKLTRFPLRNEVYRGPKSIPEAKFGSVMKEYVHMKDCIKTSPLGLAPAKRAGAAHEWVIDCDGNLLYFGQKDGQWRHTGYENINE
jgi:hypothetical protein